MLIFTFGWFIEDEVQHCEGRDPELKLTKAPDFAVLLGPGLRWATYLTLASSYRDSRPAFLEPRLS